MKLELCAGERPTPGYIHNDARALDDIEIVCDALNLISEGWVKPASCSEVRVTHALEHFSHRETRSVLTNWKALLQPGGLLYLEVPHLLGHIAAYQRQEIGAEQLVVYLYGEQDYDGNAHYTAFTAQLLFEHLVAAGFDHVQIQDIGMVLIAAARKPA